MMAHRIAALMTYSYKQLAWLLFYRTTRNFEMVQKKLLMNQNTYTFWYLTQITAVLYYCSLMILLITGTAISRVLTDFCWYCNLFNIPGNSYRNVA